MNEVGGDGSPKVESENKIPDDIRSNDIPQSLIENENFYDQEPFRSIISNASQQYSTPEEKVRTELSFIAKGRHWRQKPKEDHPDYHRWMSEEAIRTRSRPRVSFLLNSLEKYPHWYEYINLSLSRSYYSNDGTFRTISGAKPFEGMITYARWIVEKLKAEEQRKRLDEKEANTVTIQDKCEVETHPDLEMTSSCEDPKYISLSNIDLKPGESIKRIVNLGDLDTLVQVLADKLTGNKKTPVQFVGSKGTFPHSLSNLFSNQAYGYRVEEKAFIGTLKDFDVKIVPSDLVGQVDSKAIEETMKEPSVSFIVEASLYSTGRGNIGEIGRLIVLKVDKRKDGARVVRMNSQALPKNTSSLKKTIEALQAKSKLSYEAAYRAALRNIYPGGLPGLGKRK